MITSSLTSGSSQLSSLLAQLSKSKDDTTTDTGALPAGPPPSGPLPSGPPPSGPPPSAPPSAGTGTLQSLFSGLTDETTDSSDTTDLLAQIFSTLDTDQDGSVSAEELAAAQTALAQDGGQTDRPSLSQALMENDDADGNGSISAQELTNSPVGKMMDKDFQTIDTDHDDQLSATEINDFEKQMQAGGNTPPTNAAPAQFDPKSLFESLIMALSQSAQDTAYDPNALASRAYAA